MKHYYSAFVVNILGLIAGYALAGFTGVFTVFLLSVLETSLSVDNAVVNAKVLGNWDEKWRSYFIWVGLPIAVFGMRLLFPLLIVSMTTDLGIIEVFDLAKDNPSQYAKALSNAHIQIAGFGGAFLWMVFGKYFLDKDKDNHWLHWFEVPLGKLGNVESSEVLLTLGASAAVSLGLLQGSEASSFMLASVFGILTYILSHGLGAFTGGEEGGSHIQQGIMGLIFLEILDASFSFDGVIGAFAINDNIFLIALGLGVGAMYVRSITLHLVESGTLAEYAYLENGAFWAIGTLAAIMFVGVATEVPEAVTGLLGAGFIIIAFIHSWIKNEQDKAVSIN